MWRTPSNQEPGITTKRLVTKHGEPAKPGARAYDKETGRLAQVGLAQQVKMWPTPTTRDYKDGTAKSCENVPVNGLLGRAVHLWPTPHANCGNGIGEHGTGGQNLQTAAGGQLNPDWVCWLMGFPVGWTDIGE